MVQMSVPLSVGLMEELTQYANQHSKRPSTIAFEVLEQWIMSKREKERLSAQRYAQAAREDRETISYGSSLHEADSY
jgi:hypothetical protein